MKKLVILLVMMFIASNVAYALTSSKDVTMSVTVNSQFALSVSKTAIDFGSVVDNTSAGPDFVDVSTVVSTGNSWTLKFKHTGMKSGAYEIPADNIYMLFTKDAGASGTPNATYTTTAAFPADNVEALLYTSAANEIGSYTHNATVSMYVPSLQKGGAYTDTMTFTLTES
ncbi:MAG: hypothetical protein PHT32_08510 [Candidatus Omnitrophica bacterium]|nr:hypothetical protein [Candidatus Omnitrophota bacterium]